MQLTAGKFGAESMGSALIERQALRRVNPDDFGAFFGTRFSMDTGFVKTDLFIAVTAGISSVACLAQLFVLWS